ncbi:MAG: ATP-binding protein, partial [Bdellovibrionota bacterium]
MPFIEKDLNKKMVFISGPRQSGKTTLAKDIIEKIPSLYLNWDDSEHRKRIIKRDWDQEQKVIVLDEIHKFSRWKNFLKGTYDTQKQDHQFIVTGSARLDIYKKGQDSMLGRFFSWRLHPLCLAELKQHFHLSDPANVIKLLNLGGFPEPFFSNDTSFAKRWRNEKANLIFRHDIQELEKIRDIALLEFFFQALTERVSSEIILSNIARDLEIAPKTAKAWLNILEKTYALFTVNPYSKNLCRAIVKAPKVYFFDNGEVLNDDGAKFENLVANHLLKRLHFLQDSTGDKYELNYVRDKQGHEIDFLIVRNRKPMMLIEAKLSDATRSNSMYYFQEKLKVTKCLQLVMNLDKESTRDHILVTPAFDWLSQPL